MIAEKALLGTFLKNSELIKNTTVKPEHFEARHHQELMRLIQKLSYEGQAVDIISLSLYANPDTFGGVSYLNELASYADPVRIDEFEQLVVEGWKEREKRNILQTATTEDWKIQKIINSLDEINETRADDHHSIFDALQEVFEAPWIKQEPKKGVSTGIKSLNAMTNGWQDGELNIIAARPSMGKTDVMLHLAKEAGWQGNLPIIFSLEMPARQLRDRLIASTGNYNRGKMRNPYKFLTEEQKNTWSDTIGALSRTNIQIFDKAGQTVPEMRAKVRKMMHQFPDKKAIVFIDYMGLIRPNEFYGGSANLQITEISKNLKNMAKDLKIPVVCLAQLNRSVESRSDKRPMMSDIRDSGSVEQDADVIMFLYRDKYYNKDSNDNTLEMIIAKNRNGPVGTVKTLYNEHTGVITDAYHGEGIV